MSKEILSVDQFESTVMKCWNEDSEFKAVYYFNSAHNSPGAFNQVAEELSPTIDASFFTVDVAGFRNPEDIGAMQLDLKNISKMPVIKIFQKQGCVETLEGSSAVENLKNGFAQCI